MAAVGLLAVSSADPNPTPPHRNSPIQQILPGQCRRLPGSSYSHGHPGTQVVFLTPDGITCAFSAPASASCTGNTFPAVSAAESGVNSIGTDTPLDTTNAPIAHSRTTKTLPPFHTITVDGVVCGVDDARTTACKDTRGRGFVLSPNGSGWLPHV